MSLRTPLARARGLGSAKEGADHFWRQRMTAIVNLVLIGFMIYTAVALAGAPYAEAKAYFAGPLTAALTILFALSACYHMQLGMQVVIEDYVHAEGRKVLLLVANMLFTILTALICVISIIKLSLGA